MAVIPVATTYTDGVYATKYDLRRALGTSLIDYPWGQILSYRKANRQELDYVSLDQKRFGIVLTEGINTKIGHFAGLLSRLEDALAEREEEMSTYAFRKKFLLPLLSSINVAERYPASEMTLEAILSGVYNASASGPNIIDGYKLSLQSVFPLLNEESVGELYMTLLEHDEIESLYRSHNSRSVYASLTSGFTECPHERIPAMMDSLYHLLEVTELDAVCLSFIAFFLVAYLKPFEQCSREMAILLAKQVLAGHGYPLASQIIPFEEWMNASKSKLDEIFDAVTQEGDLTYIVMHGINEFTPKIEAILDEITHLRREEVRSEMVELFPLDEGKEPTVPAKPEPKPLLEEAPAPKPVKKESEPRPSVEAVRYVRETPVPSYEEATSPLSETQAISLPKASRTDKEIKELAAYIQMTNPSIKKHQALFYASHCTVGCYYSIQDYKSYTRCVYETARTSMDHLAKEGYYKKVQIKNKFVYTPIKQGV